MYTPVFASFASFIYSQPVGYTATSVALGDALGMQCTYSLIMSSFCPPSPLRFFSLPILPTVSSPTAPIHVIPSAKMYIVYSFGDHTLHITILTPSADSFPMNIDIHNVSQPFSIMQFRDSVFVITSAQMLILPTSPTHHTPTAEDQLDAVNNTLTVSLSTQTTRYKVTGLMFDKTVITEVQRIAAPHGHIILPFVCF